MPACKQDHAGHRVARFDEDERLRRANSGPKGDEFRFEPFCLERDDVRLPHRPSSGVQLGQFLRRGCTASQCKTDQENDMQSRHPTPTWRLQHLKHRPASFSPRLAMVVHSVPDRLADTRLGTVTAKLRYLHGIAAMGASQ